MSTNEQTQSETDISKLSEQEQLIFLFYFFEVSSHLFIQADQTGSNNHRRIITTIASLTPKIPFGMSRSTFKRKANEMRVSAAAAKRTVADPTVNLSQKMKQKAEQVKNSAGGSATADTPQTMFLSSTFPVREWHNGEAKVMTLVSFKRFLLPQIVCESDISFEWIDPKHLRIAITYPKAFANSCIVQEMLVDAEGKPLMPNEVPLMVEGFEQHKKNYANPNTGEMETSWIITYDQDQDTEKFFKFSDDHEGFYLEKLTMKNKDGELCPYKELHVVTMTLIVMKEERQEFVVKARNGREVSEIASLDATRSFESRAPPVPNNCQSTGKQGNGQCVSSYFLFLTHYFLFSLMCRCTPQLSCQSSYPQSCCQQSCCQPFQSSSSHHFRDGTDRRQSSSSQRFRDGTDHRQSSCSQLFRDGTDRHQSSCCQLFRDGIDDEQHFWCRAALSAADAAASCYVGSTTTTDATGNAAGTATTARISATDAAATTTIPAATDAAAAATTTATTVPAAATTTKPVRYERSCCKCSTFASKPEENCDCIRFVCRLQPQAAQTRC